MIPTRWMSPTSTSEPSPEPWNFPSRSDWNGSRRPPLVYVYWSRAKSTLGSSDFGVSAAFEPTSTPCSPGTVVTAADGTAAADAPAAGETSAVAGPGTTLPATAVDATDAAGTGTRSTQSGAGGP